MILLRSLCNNISFGYNFALPFTESSRISCTSSIVSGSALFAKKNSPGTSAKYSRKRPLLSLKGFLTSASPFKYSKSNANMATCTLISAALASFRFLVLRT